MVALLGLVFPLIVLLSCPLGFLFVYSDATGFHSYIPPFTGFHSYSLPVSFPYIFRLVFSLMVPGSVLTIVSVFFTYSAKCGLVVNARVNFYLCRVRSSLFLSGSSKIPIYSPLFLLNSFTLVHFYPPHGRPPGLFPPLMVRLSWAYVEACPCFPHLVVAVSKLTSYCFSGYDWVFGVPHYSLIFFGNIVNLHSFCN